MKGAIIAPDRGDLADKYTLDYRASRKRFTDGLSVVVESIAAPSHGTG